MKYIITLLLILVMSLIATMVVGQPAFPEDPQQAPIPFVWILMIISAIYGCKKLKQK